MSEPRGSINDWDEDGVCLFFSSLGYPQYEDAIRENGITGDLLAMMDAESLKELGLSVGQRLALLKSVYLVKLAHDIPISEDDYIPPSEVAEKQDDISLDRLHELFKNHADRLLKVEEENRILRTTLNSALEDLNRRITHGDESPLARSKSFKWPDFIKPTRSPTKAETVIDSPQPSPRRTDTDVSRSTRSNGATNSTMSSTSMATSTVSSERASTVSTAATTVEPSIANHRPSRQDSTDNLKSFKVSLEDPAWKVLPAALKKYRINNDDWQNYAMFICFGSSGNRVERCLSYDEKPLLLFQKLKDAKKNPVFMLKHIKDIRSPIAVAQQKHAARKASASSEMAASGQMSLKNNAGASGAANTAGRPPKLRVDHALSSAGTPGLMTANPLNTANAWPELMSPAVENKSDGSPGEGDAPQGSSSGHGSASREMLPMQGVSYAVAIYPYMADQEDEFDVVVGDTFVILSRARGWWVVQRDDAGTGHVDTDTSKQGWVPAGCLLETKLPVASAIAEASAKSHGASTSSNGASPRPGSPIDGREDQRKRPILPLSIVSTSFPGVALMDYQGKGEEELDLIKDESLRVFKRYNHWSYAVKEDSGERGWVPSWYIGKVAAEARPPASPTTLAVGQSGFSNTSLSSIVEAEGLGIPMIAQPSPMSSAFPGRATVVS